jgi:hypothetical protein
MSRMTTSSTDPRFSPLLSELLDKKPGSTSDRPCSGRFNGPNLVTRINTPLMPMGDTVDRVQS